MPNIAAWRAYGRIMAARYAERIESAGLERTEHRRVLVRN